MKYYIGIACLIIISACNSADNKSSVSKNDSTSVKVSKSSGNAPKFKDPKVGEIYTQYILLKDALVNTNFDMAKTVAGPLAKALQAYDGCEHTALTAVKIENAKDIAGQRLAFTDLSTDVIALFKNTSLTGGTLYVQHCPMANKGDGGDWLSSQKEVRNPYYGSEMLECGAVIAEVSAK